MNHAVIPAPVGWEPAEALGPGRAAQVAGVEAAIWAETISGFDDLGLRVQQPGRADALVLDQGMPSQRPVP